MSRDSGHWITIGAHEGADGKRRGGSPVFVKDGRILKGHPGLTGKRIDALQEPGEAIGTHRQQMNRSKEYERAKWGKQARQEGIEPKALHQFAAEIMAHDKEYKADITAMLQYARKAAKEFGVGNLGRSMTAFQHGDYDQVKGFDDVAEQVRGAYPHLFAGTDPEARLAELLSAGNPEPMSEEDAYRQAFEHLEEHRPSAEREPGDEDEPSSSRRRRQTAEAIPFARGGQPMAISLSPDQCRLASQARDLDDAGAIQFMRGAGLSDGDARAALQYVRGADETTAAATADPWDNPNVVAAARQFLRIAGCPPDQLAERVAALRRFMEQWP